MFICFFRVILVKKFYRHVRCIVQLMRKASKVKYKTVHHMTPQVINKLKFVQLYVDCFTTGTCPASPDPTNILTLLSEILKVLYSG